MKIAFLSTRPEKPSYRFRVAPFLPALAGRGWSVETVFVARSFLARRAQWRALGRVDVVVVQKRLLGGFDLWALRRRARRLVFDLDDAIMLTSDGRPDGGKRGRRFRAMLAASDLVLAGNEYLAEAAAGCARRVEILPTVVDTDRYRPPPTRRNGPVTIGWSGSSSTNRYLTDLLATVARPSTPTPFRLLAVSDRAPAGAGDWAVDYEPWSDATEVELLQRFDVGIMPLDDTPWSRGKCGLKALLTQAVGAPAVCSPVGVNSRVVADGETGFLAATPAEWTDRLTRLVDDPALRARLGAAGRRRVEERYSVRAVLPRLVELLEEIA